MCVCVCVTDTGRENGAFRRVYNVFPSPLHVGHVFYLEVGANEPSLAVCVSHLSPSGGRPL